MDFYPLLLELGLDPREVNWEPIPEKPLACYASPEAPARQERMGLPYVADEFCTPENARQAYRHQPEKCPNSEALNCRVRAFGALRIPHPALDIVLHLNKFEIEDFRGADTFMLAARDPQIAQLPSVAEERTLKILYPGSGSHMAGTLLAFDLIDAGKIDSADIYYTEIDRYAVLKIKDYLDFWQEHKVIGNVDLEVFDFDYRKEFAFTFKYQGKPVQLTVSVLNMTQVVNKEHVSARDRRQFPELPKFIYRTDTQFPKNVPEFDSQFWAPQDIVDNADLVIEHDGLGLEELKHYADRFAASDRPRLLMMEPGSLKTWQRNPTSGILEEIPLFPPENIATQSSIKGFYGCHTFSPGYNETNNISAHDSELQEYTEPEYFNAGSAFAPRMMRNIRGDLHSDMSSIGAALLVTVKSKK